MSENKRSLGSVYEDLACKSLAEKGYTIIERNYRCKYGEIDIIAADGAALVFIEVKYRHSKISGFAVEAVSFPKQRTISKVAAFFCMKNRIPETAPCRFDVIAFDGWHLKHYVNAFDYISS
ncbi:MAG: YraN family protein [Eubacterium sp.]|nr:YraN family protein [Eubacterium sp.]